MAVDETISGKELADFLGLTERRLRQLVQDQHMKKAGRGKYFFKDSVQSYMAFLKEASEKKGDATYQAESLRKLTAEADKAEFEASIMRGDLAPIEEITATWSHIAMEVRTNVLAIATKAASRINADMSKADIQAVIADEVDGCLEALSKTEVVQEE